MEPFPTSVLQVLIEVIATETKICTRGRSTRAHALGFVTTSTSAYSSGHRFYPEGEVWVRRLSAIHFQGYYIRLVGCYTILSGSRLPWSPSNCHNVITPFVVSDERLLWHLNLAFGSSRIASSAYQKWPTSIDTFECPRSIKQQGLLTYLKFENG
jgi:hypothetical protein